MSDDQSELQSAQIHRFAQAYELAKLDGSLERQGGLQAAYDLFDAPGEGMHPSKETTQSVMELFAELSRYRTRSRQRMRNLAWCAALLILAGAVVWTTEVSWTVLLFLAASLALIFVGGVIIARTQRQEIRTPLDLTNEHIEFALKSIATSSMFTPEK